MSDSLHIVVPDDLDKRLRQAAGLFWSVRQAQQSAQARKDDQDRGSRAAVTGGKQMDGFVRLLAEMLISNGLPAASLFLDEKLDLPGYYRATKKWDLVVVHRGHLLAAAELKSQVGSFSNNVNNRIEEAVGSAADIWVAYRENAFGLARRPWLGYLFLLEECPASTRPVAVSEPHFDVFPEFRHASYAKRYIEMCRRLVKENLYTEAALLMAQQNDLEGQTLREPAPELAFRPFAQSLLYSVQIALSALTG